MSQHQFDKTFNLSFLANHLPAVLLAALLLVALFFSVETISLYTAIALAVGTYLLKPVAIRIYRKEVPWLVVSVLLALVAFGLSVVFQMMLGGFVWQLLAYVLLIWCARWYVNKAQPAAETESK